MSTASSVVAQLQSEISRANTATGGSAASVHAAIAELIAGYGSSGSSGGGGVQTGSFVPANDTGSISVPVTGTPTTFVICKKYILQQTPTQDIYNIMAGRIYGAEYDFAVAIIDSEYLGNTGSSFVTIGNGAVTISNVGGFIAGEDYSWVAVSGSSSQEPVAPPTINGNAFDCGSFVLAENVSSSYSVNHSLGAVPSAVFLFAVDSPAMEDGVQLRYVRGQMRFNSDDEDSSVNATAVNGNYNALNGMNSTSPKATWTNSQITFGANATYPFRAGLTYQWLAIA